jgi:hypothetical protein
MQSERMGEINENITALEEEIKKVRKVIFEKKMQLKDQIEVNQKEEIKRLFMEKAATELEKELLKYEKAANSDAIRLHEERH